MTEDVLKSLNAKEERGFDQRRCEWRTLRAISEDTACTTVVEEIRITRAGWEPSCSVRIRGTNSMPDERGERNQQQPLELTTDFLGEDRHEFVAKLAYKLWEERGRPFGSPEVDWFAAERALYSSLVASGLVAPSASDSQHIAEKIYW